MNFNQKDINENLLVFESNPDFSDNSRGFWDYINKHTNYRTYWVLHDIKMVNLLKSKGIECGFIDSDDAKKNVEIAKFLVTSSFEFAFSKKANQIHISLWHGFPLKLIGFFDSATADVNNMDELKIITTQSDLIACTSRFSQLTISGMFAMDPRKVKEIGYPRNDIMLNSNGRKELNEIINVGDSKLILYLPTMRKGLKAEGKQFAENIFNYLDYNATEIDEFLEKEDAYIVAKLHFADDKYFEKGDFTLPKRIFFLNNDILTSNLKTIYHIMNAFDVLITDYSSVYVDYLLLDKPIIFSCPDFEEYKSDRGFILDNPKLLMPGQMIKSQTELIDELKLIFRGIDNFRQERADKFSFFHYYKDNNSAKRLLNVINSIGSNISKDAGKDTGLLFYPDRSNLYQYTLKGTAIFYLDSGNGFSEDHKLVENFVLDGYKNVVKFKFTISNEIKNIKFCPDLTARWMLKNFRLLQDNKELKEYYVIDGKKVHEYILLNIKEPQIIINLNDNLKKEIEIYYECIDLYFGINMITSIFEDDHKELLAVKNSASWRLTKPLRKFKKIVQKGK